MSRANTIGQHKTTVTGRGGSCSKTLTVRYQATNVVTVDWATGIITLDTGGWRTPTTKLRMNQAARAWGLGYHVYQANGAWYVDIDGAAYNYADEVFRFTTPSSRRQRRAS